MKYLISLFISLILICSITFIPVDNTATELPLETIIQYLSLQNN